MKEMLHVSFGIISWKNAHPNSCTPLTKENFDRLSYIFHVFHFPGTGYYMYVFFFMKGSAKWSSGTVFFVHGVLR